MVATHTTKIKRSTLSVTGVYIRDVTYTIFAILHLNASHLCIIIITIIIIIIIGGGGGGGDGSSSSSSSSSSSNSRSSSSSTSCILESKINGI